MARELRMGTLGLDSRSGLGYSVNLGCAGGWRYGAGDQVASQPGVRLDLAIRYLGGHRHLPIITVKRAA